MTGGGCGSSRAVSRQEDLADTRGDGAGWWHPLAVGSNHEAPPRLCVTGRLTGRRPAQRCSGGPSRTRSVQRPGACFARWCPSPLPAVATRVRARLDHFQRATAWSTSAGFSRGRRRGPGGVTGRQSADEAVCRDSAQKAHGASRSRYDRVPGAGSSASIDRCQSRRFRSAAADPPAGGRRRRQASCGRGKELEREAGDRSGLRDHPGLRARWGFRRRSYDMNPLEARLRTSDTARAAAGRATAQSGGWRRRRKIHRWRRPGAFTADLAWERITDFSSAVVPPAEEHWIRPRSSPPASIRACAAAGFLAVSSMRVLRGHSVEGMKRFARDQCQPVSPGSTCAWDRRPRAAAAAGDRDSRCDPGVLRDAREIFNIHFPQQTAASATTSREVRPGRKATCTMPDVMRTLQQVGYSYMVMPDHMPRLRG